MLCEGNKGETNAELLSQYTRIRCSGKLQVLSGIIFRLRDDISIFLFVIGICMWLFGSKSRGQQYNNIIKNKTDI